MPNTNVTTGVCRLSFAHIWKAHSSDDKKDPKFSAMLIIPKKDKTTLEKIKSAIESAKETARSKLGGKLPKDFKIPLKKVEYPQDEDGNDIINDFTLEEFLGDWYVNASAKTKPDVIDRYGNEILNPEEVYSGCYVRVGLNFYFYNNESKGIACGLDCVQKIKDGDSLGRRSPKSYGFGTDEDDEVISAFLAENGDEELDELDI